MDVKQQVKPAIKPRTARGGQGTAHYIADIAGEMESMARRSGFEALARALNLAKKEAARAALDA